jgi:hypothetical protein
VVVEVVAMMRGKRGDGNELVSVGRGGVFPLERTNEDYFSVCVSKYTKIKPVKGNVLLEFMMDSGSYRM